MQSVAGRKEKKLAASLTHIKPELNNWEKPGGAFHHQHQDTFPSTQIHQESLQNQAAKFRPMLTSAFNLSKPEEQEEFLLFRKRTDNSS